MLNNDQWTSIALLGSVPMIEDRRVCALVQDIKQPYFTGFTLE